MEENKIYELLYQKNESLQKRLNRNYLFILILPLIYLLLENSLISTVNTPLISITQSEIILSSFPLIYSFLFLSIFSFGVRLKKVNYQIDKIESETTVLTEDIKDMLTQSTVVDFTNGIFPMIYSKGTLGCLFLALINLPIFIFMFFYPIIFLSYTIYRNFKYSGKFEIIAFWCSIIAIWVFVIIIVLIISLLINRKASKANNF